MKYYTKCGIPFEKSSNAVVTGSPIPEKDGKISSDKCASCPWPVEVKEGYPEQHHKRWECRAGSEPPNHTTEWRGSLNDKNTLNIYSLDVALMTEIIAFAQGHPDLSAAYNVDSMADCRRTISVSCSSNKKGMAAKKELIEKFFPVQDATEDPTDETYSVGICDPTGEDMGVCELTNKSVSRVRPGCENFDADIFDDEEDIDSMDLEDKLDVLLEQGDAMDQAAKEVPQGCPKYDCPFHVYEDEGCDFNREERTRDQDHGSWYKDVRMAVEEYGCKLPNVLQAHKILADEEMASEAEATEPVNETAPDVVKPVEEEQAPAFDYSEVDHDTADFLQEKANRITEIRIKSVIAIGRELKEAQDRLANHYGGTFEKWVSGIGISDQTARNYINGYEWVSKNFANLEDAENIQPSLLFAASKPSAPPELAEAVISGDITKHKDYQEALKKLKEAESSYQTVSESYDKLEKVNKEHYERAKLLETQNASLLRDYESGRTRIKNLTEQIDQIKAESDPSKLTELGGVIKEKQGQIKDLESEVARLHEELNAKPIEVSAVEVREVVPKSIRDTWCETITDAISTIANLYADDIGTLIDGMRLNVPGYLDGGGFEREIGDAIAYLEKLHELLTEKEEPTDEND